MLSLSPRVSRWLAVSAAGVMAGLAIPARAAGPAAARLEPNLEGRLERPLRYRPDHGDFVVENGAEWFNRPLYGGNTAFRVDAGDRPEFLLYLPGRGGNLRLGLSRAGESRWLHDAEWVEARYRPGMMVYRIRDPLLGPAGELELTAVALAETEGLAVRVCARGCPAGTGLVWAFGGADGRRGRRDGDIGTEAVPIAEYFQLRPDCCRGNRFTLAGNRFTLEADCGELAGTVSGAAELRLGDASGWGDCAALLGSRAAGAPVVVGRMALAPDRPAYLALQRLRAGKDEELDIYREVTARRSGAAAEVPPAAAPLSPAFAPEELAAVFARAVAHFDAVRGRVRVETPDPYLDAAVGALNVAADAVWDEPQGVVMHGAIAWRAKLLGWRGAYAQDALGWHERARRHFAYWAGRQNTEPVPAQPPPADEAANLARNEAGLHSNGDLSNSHYDMNLVYIDALFRHLRWTGDLGFARAVWPVIERHLAWEHRLFRREFTTRDGERLPLYEAYAAIWASDDLGYHGGGVAYASAYNCWHNHEAAAWARRLGADPAPYDVEEAAIRRGLRELLWDPGRGAYAEFRDYLGLRRTHPSAGLWTVYHAIDSAVPSPAEALALTLEADRRLPALPVRGPGIPADRDYRLHATTDWMPYTWSVNNVVFGENVHAALAYWQAGRPEAAFTLLKAALLASMYLGICPGNVGSMNYLDVQRRESQRDFADGGGVLARAVVEGLFGVRPDAAAGELLLSPGFPEEWPEARLEHPDLAFGFRRAGMTDTYDLAVRTPVFRRVRLRLPARAEEAECVVAGVGQPGQLSTDESGRRWLELVFAGAPELTVAVRWGGTRNRWAEPAVPTRALPVPRSAVCGAPTGRLEAVDLGAAFNDRVTELFRPGKYRSPRSPFVSLAIPAQGIGAWAGQVDAMAELDDSGLRAAAAAGGNRFRLPGGLWFATPGAPDAPNVLFTSQWDNYPAEATLPLSGRAYRLHLLLAGSTNAMQSRLDNGEVVATYADGTCARLALRNPETWWPIEQDYFVDDYQFAYDGTLPVRVDLKTGVVRVPDAATFRGRGGVVPGGAATVLELPLDRAKELRSLTVRALANEVVVGLMAATLER